MLFLNRQSKYNLLLSFTIEIIMSRHTPNRNDPLDYNRHKSEPQTANPTTNKKTFKRTSPQKEERRSESKWERIRSLSHQILTLQTKKMRYMQMRQYLKAEKIDKNIRMAKSQFAYTRVSVIVDNQRDEKRSVSQAHKTEIKYFQRSWNNYFGRLQERESQILRCFKEQQEREVVEAQFRVRRRCKSLNSSSSEIVQLKEKEILLRKRADFGYLSHVKRQLAEAVLKQRRRLSLMKQRVAELQQDRLSIYQSKKYAVLVMRLQEYRKDKERVYLRQQKRLKQKYRNVLQQLKHDQTVQLEQTNRLAIAMQY